MRTVPGIVVMEYIPSILNPEIRITKLKDRFRLYTSFLHGNVGRATQALIYSCLYDSSVKTKTPYVHTTYTYLRRHFKIKHIINNFLLMMNDEVIQTDFIDRLDFFGDGKKATFRINLNVLPDVHGYRIPYVWCDKDIFTTKDKMTYIVYTYIKKLNNSKKTKKLATVDTLTKELNINRGNIYKAISALSFNNLILWDRYKSPILTLP